MTLTKQGRKVLHDAVKMRSQYPRILYLGNAPDPKDRPQLLLNQADSDAFEATTGTRRRVTVTDQKTGKRFVVRRGSCGLPRCLCAAFIVREVR